MYSEELQNNRTENLITQDINIQVDLTAQIEKRFSSSHLMDLAESIVSDPNVINNAFVDNVKAGVIAQIEIHEKYSDSILSVMDLNKLIVASSLHLETSSNKPSLSPWKSDSSQPYHQIEFPAHILIKCHNFAPSEVINEIRETLLDLWGDRFLVEPSSEGLADLISSMDHPQNLAFLDLYEFDKVLGDCEVRICHLDT